MNCPSSTWDRTRPRYRWTPPPRGQRGVVRALVGALRVHLARHLPQRVNLSLECRSRACVSSKKGCVSLSLSLSGEGRACVSSKKGCVSLSLSLSGEGRERARALVVGRVVSSLDTLLRFTPHQVAGRARGHGERLVARDGLRARHDGGLARARPAPLQSRARLVLLLLRLLMMMTSIRSESVCLDISLRVLE